MITHVSRDIRHKDLNTLDFDSLCTETFNEEQSIRLFSLPWTFHALYVAPIVLLGA
jgi:hypothetical protein